MWYQCVWWWVSLKYLNLYLSKLPFYLTFWYWWWWLLVMCYQFCLTSLIFRFIFSSRTITPSNFRSQCLRQPTVSNVHGFQLHLFSCLDCWYLISEDLTNAEVLISTLLRLWAPISLVLSFGISSMSLATPLFPSMRSCSRLWSALFVCSLGIGRNWGLFGKVLSTMRSSCIGSRLRWLAKIYRSKHQKRICLGILSPTTFFSIFTKTSIFRSWMAWRESWSKTTSCDHLYLLLLFLIVLFIANFMSFLSLCL